MVEQAEFPVGIPFFRAGPTGRAKGDVVNLLNEWMDRAHIQVHALRDPTDEERAHPLMYRFWRRLPPKGKGKTGSSSGPGTPRPSPGASTAASGAASWTRTLAEIGRFERMLADEGALIVKLWLHLPKKAQRHRLAKLESKAATAWRVTPQDWKDHRRYDRFLAVTERALRDTSTAEAPWTVIEATDARYRRLTVGRTLLDAMHKRLDRGKRPAVLRAAPPPAPPIDARDVIEEIDLSLKLSQEKYDKELPELQARLHALAYDKRFRDHACVVVFEGNDAAGKGGAVRRVTRALDARIYDVVPIAAPTEEERAQPYLWRFWRHLPRRGRFTVFDRSWYGRVLVERVEGFAAEPAFMRAYREIVDFEESLVRSGIVLVKLWLAISPEEQLRSGFHAREKTPFKRFKITADDWRNRKKWDAYQRAVCDMVDRTSTEPAPWHLVEANDKKWARVKVLETVCEAIERVL